MLNSPNRETEKHHSATVNLQTLPILHGLQWKEPLPTRSSWSPSSQCARSASQRPPSPASRPSQKRPWPHASCSSTSGPCRTCSCLAHCPPSPGPSIATDSPQPLQRCSPRIPPPRHLLPHLIILYLHLVILDPDGPLYAPCCHRASCGVGRWYLEPSGFLPTASLWLG